MADQLPALIGAATFLTVLLSGLAVIRLRHVLRRRQVMAQIQGTGQAGRPRIALKAASYISKLGKQLTRLLPTRFNRATKNLLASAGFYSDHNYYMFLLLELAISFTYLVLAFPAALLLFGGPISMLIFGILILIPYVVLRVRSTRRQNQMVRELPMLVDLLMLVVSGGLGLTSAIEKLTQHQEGLLVGELNRTREDILLGFTRAAAFGRLAERTKAPEIRRFAEAIMKVDQLGMSLNLVLSSQARAIRLRRLTQAKIRSERITVKILFPVIFCFLPGVFIVSVGPAIFDIIGALLGE